MACSAPIRDAAQGSWLALRCSRLISGVARFGRVWGEMREPPGCRSGWGRTVAMVQVAADRDCRIAVRSGSASSVVLDNSDGPPPAGRRADLPGQPRRRPPGPRDLDKWTSVGLRCRRQFGGITDHYLWVGGMSSCAYLWAARGSGLGVCCWRSGWWLWDFAGWAPGRSQTQARMARLALPAKVPALKVCVNSRVCGPVTQIRLCVLTVRGCSGFLGAR